MISRDICRKAGNGHLGAFRKGNNEMFTCWLVINSRFFFYSKLRFGALKCKFSLNFQKLFENSYEVITIFRQYLADVWSRIQLPAVPVFGLAK